MTTFSIELTDDQAQRLRQLAIEAGISPEELLGEGIREWLLQPRNDFADAAAFVLRKNRDLYKRLA
jgi:predicted transcriptional regulator